MACIFKQGDEALLFHNSDYCDVQREHGNSAIIEMQFCKFPAGTDIKKIVSVDSIKHWQNDSLYIDDENLFFDEYKNIFNCGIYANLKSGVVDICGLNYYAPEITVRIIEKINAEKPAGYEILAEWLNISKNYNGFYILGI